MSYYDPDEFIEKLCPSMKGRVLDHAMNIGSVGFEVVGAGADVGAEAFNKLGGAVAANALANGFDKIGGKAALNMGANAFTTLGDPTKILNQNSSKKSRTPKAKKTVKFE